jgi:transposase
MSKILLMGQHTPIHLITEQRNELERLIRAGHSPARTQTRARILLLSDQSSGQKRTAREVAAALLCSPSTVANVRRRFNQNGLQAALYEKPRPGQKPKVTGDIEAKLTMLACSQPPEGHARWTLRLLAERMVELEYIDYISHVTVREVLKKTNLSLGG